MSDAVSVFLSGTTFAVAGASQNREKYGNKILRCYMQHGRDVVPLNPTATEVEGLPAFPSLADVPESVDGLSIVTPPHITDQVVADAIAAGVSGIWMQPGAESPAAIEAAEAAGISVIHSGPCLLVVLGYSESA